MAPTLADRDPFATGGPEPAGGASRRTAVDQPRAWGYDAMTSRLSARRPPDAAWSRPPARVLARRVARRVQRRRRLGRQRRRRHGCRPTAAGPGDAASRRRRPAAPADASGELAARTARRHGGPGPAQRPGRDLPRVDHGAGHRRRAGRPTAPRRWPPAPTGSCSPSRPRPTRGPGGSAQATLTLRVPPTAFGPTLDALGRLGKELDRQRSAEDVTTQVADVDSRVRSQQRSVDRVRVAALPGRDDRRGRAGRGRAGPARGRPGVAAGPAGQAART